MVWPRPKNERPEMTEDDMELDCEMEKKMRKTCPTHFPELIKSMILCLWPDMCSEMMSCDRTSLSGPKYLVMKS